jgi:hypothetical protein
MGQPYSKSKYHPNGRDLTGQVFGRWVVVAFSGYVGPNREAFWECRCDCGVTRPVRAASLLNGRSSSCGCYNRERVSWVATSHGKCTSREYRIWANMIQRCHNSSSSAYDRYGGRGIQVCPQWRNSFDDFLEHMGESPSKDHSIDRIDNNGNYEPGNCRWATRDEQMLNTRRNRRYEFSGKSLTIGEWSEVLGIDKGTLVSRLKLGWSVEKTLSTPLNLRRSDARRRTILEKSTIK